MALAITILKILPPTESPFMAPLVKVDPPGIMTQSKPVVFLPVAPYPQATEPYIAHKYKEPLAASMVSQVSCSLGRVGFA